MYYNNDVCVSHADCFILPYITETSKLFLSVMEKADPKLKNQLVTQFKVILDS